MKKSLLLYILISLSSLLSVYAQLAGNWKAVGPVKFPINVSGQIHGIGRATQLKFHPANSQKMYVTTATGGVYISTDGGTNWTVTGTDKLFRNNCASICIDHTNDQILYLGTGDPNYYSTYNGVYKSTDGGATWSASNSGIGNRMAVEILMSPSNNSVLIAATNDGIWKSTNAGASWTVKKSGGNFTEMVFKPGDANTVYAATHTQFFRSTDMGETWTQITLSGSGLLNGGRIGVSKADPNVVYVTFVGDFDAGTSTPVFKSANSGQSFTVVKTSGQPNLNGYNPNEGGQGNYNYAITVDPADANTVYVVGHVVSKSTDGGANWTKLTNWYAKVHTDMHQIVFSPYDNTKLYNVNDGGVWLSTDGGNNWTTKSDGLSSTEIYRAAQSPVRKDLMDIGTQDNGELHYFNNTWYTNGGGDYGGHVAFDYQNTQDVYHLNDASKKRLNGGGGAAAFALPFSGYDGNGNNVEIEFNSLQTNTAFTSYQDVYRTTNLSSAPPTWTKISSIATQIKALASSPADMNLLYAVTNNNRVYRSDNALAGSPSFTNLAAPGATNVRASIALISNNTNVVYISCGSKVYRSSDKGVTWTDISTGLPNVNIIKIIHDKHSTDESVYLAMATAVYYRNNTMSSWMNYSNGLPTIANINEFMIFNDGTANSEIRVGYYGRGVWGSTLFNNTNSYVTISSPTDGAIITPGSNLTISASVSVGSGKTISKVEFYRGTTLIGTSTTSPYSVIWNNVPAGQYTLTAKAYETSGTVVTSAIVNINVSPIGTTVYQDCNYGGYSVSLVEGSYTLSQLQALGISNDDISSIKVVSGYQVILYADDNFLGSTVTLTADNSCLVANSFNDNASSIKIIKINTPPAIAITTPANNAVYTTAPAIVAITATATDSDGTISKVEFYNGATLLGTSATSPYTYNWTGVASGTYTLTAKAYDNNNVVTTSSAVFIRVNKAPSVSITIPANNALYTTVPASVNITASATDADGTINKVEFYNGTTLLGTSTASPYSYNWTGVGAGTYSLTAKAYDNNGTVTTSSVISIKVNQAPVVSITAPANNAVYTTAPATVTITATASDADGTISKVEFYNGTTLLGTSTTSPYTYNWTSVASGNYTLTAKAYDNNGSVTTSSAVSVRVNKVPTVSITAPANNTVYVAPAIVNITAAATDADGTVSKVEFYNGTTLLGTSTASPYTYNWTNVAAGTYTLTAKAYDNNGSVSTSGTITVQVNTNTAPTVSITSPLNNAVISPAPATVNITASAVDADGTISKVEFYNGSTLLGTSSSSPFSYNWTNVASGTYILTAKAYDNLNLSTVSYAITVIVNIAPVVSVTSPVNNTSFTSPAIVNITASASDADGSISKVEFYNGTTLLGTSTVNPYSFSWTNVPEGAYSITARAYDNRGTMTTSSSVGITVNTPVNNSPTVSITSPANNTNYTAPANISISANATDADGSISKVEFYNGSILLGTASASPYVFNWSGAAAGTYSITAKAYDNLGATATSSIISIIVNNALPVITITSPVTNDNFIAPANISITTNASDANGSIAKVEFYNGSTLLFTSTTSPYAYTWTNVAAGNYIITAKAYDDLGATTTASVNVTVKVNTAPTVSITSPANNSVVMAPASITITANASDTDGSISKVEFYNGTTLLSTSTSAPYSYNWTNVSGGTYTITAKAYDNLGATATTSVAITVSTNNAPSVSIVSPANNQIYTQPATFTITADAFDSDGTVTKVEFYNGNVLLSTSTISPYTFTASNVAAGTFTISAKAYDNLGSSATASVNIIVNTNSAPSVSLISPANGETFKAPATINITANASDADGSITKVEFYYDNTLLSTSTVSPYSYSWTNVQEGIYFITAKAYDNLGGSSTAMVDITVKNVTSVSSASTEISLLKCYPNPFESKTTVALELGQSGNVLMEVYNSQGIKITELFNGHLNAGSHNFDFDSDISEGTYYCKIKTLTSIETIKLVKVSRPKVVQSDVK